MHSTASAFNKVSRLGTRPPGFYSKSAAQNGARSSPHLPGLAEVAGQPAIPAVNETFDVAGYLANRSSIKINLKTTFANQGKGSPMGVIEIRSERLHVRCDEILPASGTLLQAAMADLLPDFQPRAELMNTQQKAKAEQQHQARLQASPDPPMPVHSSNKVLKIKDMYNNAGSEFVLSKVEGSMAELLGDITQMVFGLDAASQTRKEALARGGKGRTYFVDVESVAGTGSAVMVSLRSGNCTLAILGAVMDKDGQLHMGICKAALDASSCKCAPLRPIMRKAAFPLPTGDCYDSHLTLEFLDKRGRSHGPGLMLVTRFARVVVDLKKSPEARGDMIRIRINELGIADLLEIESDAFDASVVQGQSVTSADLHRQSGPASFPHPLSLGSEPKHNLLNYTEQDERASSTQSLGSDLEYGTRTGSKVKISPVSLVSSIGSHSGSKTAALQATSGNRTHEDPSSTRATLPAKVRRGLENGSIVPGDLKLPRRRPYFSDEEKQAAIRESFDGEISRAHDVTAELRAPRDAAQKATGKMSGKARKGELEGESLERSLQKIRGRASAPVSAAELDVSKRSPTHPRSWRDAIGAGSTQPGPK